jgi:hypothetical protein
MNLFDELLRLIHDYLAGRIAFDVVYRWVGRHVQDIDESGDLHLQELADDVWILGSEWQDGFRDERSVRDEMAREVSPEPGSVIGLMATTGANASLDLQSVGTGRGYASELIWAFGADAHYQQHDFNGSVWPLHPALPLGAGLRVVPS